MKIIISMVSCILFFSAAYAGTKLKQFEPLLNEFEMDLLQRRVDTLSEDKTIDQAVDFFALSCFGTDEQKTTGLYLGSVSRKQVESGGRFVIDNTPLRIYLK